jgi:uncharacterized damage-inducible protein DinB
MTPEQAKLLAEVFVNQLEDEFKTTKRVLAAVPEDRLDYKLGEKGRTARELMWHIVGSEIWFGSGLAAGEFAAPGEEEPAPPTVAEMVAVFETQVPPVIEKVKALTGERLATPMNFFNVMNVPAVLYLPFWASHTIHHRGQLSTYLRAMNARVPDIYGGSADEPFQMPATAP